MNEPQKDERPRALDTQRMHRRLMDDTFPPEQADFLDEDVGAFFDQLLERTGKKKSEVIRQANLPRVYGYQLMEGRRRGRRDYYLLLALSLSLDLKDTQRMLSLTRCGALHPLIKRDAAVIFALNHGYDRLQTYELMCAHGLPPLEERRD